MMPTETSVEILADHDIVALDDHLLNVVRESNDELVVIDALIRRTGGVPGEDVDNDGPRPEVIFDIALQKIRKLIFQKQSERATDNEDMQRAFSY